MKKNESIILWVIVKILFLYFMFIIAKVVIKPLYVFAWYSTWTPYAFYWLLSKIRMLLIKLGYSINHIIEVLPKDKHNEVWERVVRSPLFYKTL